MTQSGGVPPSDRPGPVRRKPPSAREADGQRPDVVRPKDGRASRQRGGRSPTRGGKRPTPARALSGGGAAVEPPVEERFLDIDGQRWRVRVLGRARAGRTGPGAHLLLLGFWSDDSTSEKPEREALVAVDGIDALGPGAIRHALDAARAPTDPNRPKPFFDDGRRRRG